MKQIKKKTLIFVSFILITSLTETLNSQKINETAPDFTLYSLDGDTFTLSDHFGKVVFIYLFGHGCPYCRAIGPTIESDIYQKFKDHEDFEAIGIDLWDGTKNNVINFQSKTGMSFPLLKKGSAMAVNYNTTYDRILVVDKEGILKHKGTTPAANDLDNAIQSVSDQLGLPTTLENIEKNNVIVNHYPNPVVENVKIRFSSNNAGQAKLVLYDISGKEIQTLFDGTTEAGINEINYNSFGLTKGIYFYKLDLDGKIITRKIIFQ